jgi:predicted MFS family arabinose efflux permease
MIGHAAGPLLAGLIMDNLNPRLVWFAASLSMVLAGILSWFLHRRDQLRSREMLPAHDAHAFVQASD